MRAQLNDKFLITKYGMNNCTRVLILNHDAMVNDIRKITPHFTFKPYIGTWDNWFLDKVQDYYNYVIYEDRGKVEFLDAEIHIWNSLRRSGLLFVKTNKNLDKYKSYYDILETIPNTNISVLRKRERTTEDWEFSVQPPERIEKYGEEFVREVIRTVPMDRWGNEEEVLRVTKDAIKGLEELGFTPFVYGGAPLGLHRDGELLFWDNDIDLGVLLDKTMDNKVFGKMLEDKFHPMGYTVIVGASPHGWGNFAKIGLTNGVHIDMKFFVPNGDKIVFGGGGLPNYPINWFKEFTTVPYKGVDLRIPKAIEAYLRYDFGSNWKTRIVGLVGQWETKVQDCWKFRNMRKF